MKALLSLGVAVSLVVASLSLLAAGNHDKHSAGSGAAGEDARFAASSDPHKPLAVEARRHRDEDYARNYFTDLPVIDQEGQTLRFYSDVLKGRVVLINFAYTNCENGCPVITQQLVQVKERLGARFGADIFFVTISTDPERDDPPALKAFAEKQQADDPGWIFLTGAKPDLDRIITRLGQYSPEPEQHSSLLLAGNVATRHWVKIRPNAPLTAMAYKLIELADE